MLLTGYQARGRWALTPRLPAIAVALACSLAAFEAVAAIPHVTPSAGIRIAAPDAKIMAETKRPEPAKPLTGDPKPRPALEPKVRPYRPLQTKMTSLQCAREATNRGLTNPFSPERRAFIASCLKW